MKQYLEAGIIINKRGLKGELKVDSLCDDLDVFCDINRFYLDEDGRDSVNVISSKQYKGYAYVILDGINSAELADKMRGKTLYASREDIKVEDGKIFIQDLIGLRVFDADSGVEYGIVADVFNRGASDIYLIEKDGGEYYLPAVPEFVVSVDMEKGIFVRPIPGIFDEAEKV